MSFNVQKLKKIVTKPFELGKNENREKFLKSGDAELIFKSTKRQFQIFKHKICRHFMSTKTLHLTKAGDS